MHGVLIFRCDKSFMLGVRRKTQSFPRIRLPLLSPLPTRMTYRVHLPKSTQMSPALHKWRPPSPLSDSRNSFCLLPPLCTQSHPNPIFLNNAVYAHLCIHGYDDTHVEVRGQHVGGSSLLPPGSGDFSSGGQAPFLAEPTPPSFYNADQVISSPQ